MAVFLVSESMRRTIPATGFLCFFNLSLALFALAWCLFLELSHRLISTLRACDATRDSGVKIEMGVEISLHVVVKCVVGVT